MGCVGLLWIVDDTVVDWFVGQCLSFDRLIKWTADRILI